MNVTAVPPAVSWVRILWLGPLLTTLVLTTVLGNILVIAAVLVYRPLRRSITNFFLVSLACADLLMGLFVMPFSVYMELLNSGQPAVSRLWCDLWHALDVLSSTASILNLCMIALERFWATRSHSMAAVEGVGRRRCALMIGLAWACSAAISFPAIAWWRAIDRHNITSSSSSSLSTSSPFTKESQCKFPDDQVYILLSSSISFYIPLIIMLVVYARVYRTATGVMRTLTAGTKVVYKDHQSGQVLRLGVHRGGTPNNHNNNYHHQHQPQHSHSQISQQPLSLPHSSSSTCQLNYHQYQTNRTLPIVKETSFLCFRKFFKKLRYRVTHEPAVVGDKASVGPESSACYRQVSFTPRPSPVHLPPLPSPPPDTGPSPSFRSPSITSQTPFETAAIVGIRRRGSIGISLGKKFARFATEQKAAKTLGVVMGIFIVCWLPFFICNVLTALHPKALGSQQAVVMTVVTWLGYLNSAVNPIIYAHSLPHFRRAFIRLIMRLLCCPRHRRQAYLLSPPIHGGHSRQTTISKYLETTGRDFQ